MCRETSHHRTPSPIPSDLGQSSGVESSDDEEYFKLKESYYKAIELYSGVSLDADKLCDELKATRVTLGVAQQEATQAKDEKAAAEAEVQNLLVDATAACDSAFPMQTADDPTTTPEERLQALSACIRAMASEAIHQGAATTLIAVQL